MSAASPESALAVLAQSARAAGAIALDTEFMGEGRYRTLLCLIQIAIGEGAQEGERIAIIDPLAEDLDASELAAVLADPAVEVVVHAGRQDVALMRRALSTEVTNVFDTQVAAGFAGLGAQSSYESLLSEMLGLRVAKTASFTRWDTRPLSPEQLAYAREDVAHLLELSAVLQGRLTSLGRLEWARQECEAIALSSDARDPETIFSRLPRINGLGASARAVARELVQWREETAARQNRPVNGVLSDAALVEVARRRPSRRGELEAIRGLGAGAAPRRAQELLDAVERGRRRPPDPPRQHGRTAVPSREDAPIVALAEALLRARALEAGLAYELLATRAEVQAVVTAARAGADEADVRTLKGWRRELAGAELLELLEGHISLSLEDSREHARLRIERSH